MAVASYVLLACVLTVAGAATTGETDPTVHGEEDICHFTVHSWFHDAYEYFHLEDYVLAILVILTAGFEYVWHTLQHRVGHGDHADDGHDKHDESVEVTARWAYKKESQRYPAALVQRTSQELMILGFLGFLVWVALRVSVFEQVACAFSEWDGIALPDTSHGFIETVEDVHMHLFLSMIAFIILVAIGVALTQKRQEEWRVFNAVLCKATTQKSQLKIIHLGEDEKVVMDAFSNWNAAGEDFTKLCPEGMNLDAFVRFAKSRALFFARLRGLVMGDQGENPDVQIVVDIMEDLVQEANPGQSFSRSQIVEYLQSWFPFDHHLRLELHYQLMDMATIKIMTLLTLAVGLIVAAIIINFTLSVVGHFLCIGVQLMVSFVMGISLPWVLRKKKLEQDVSDEHLLGVPAEGENSPVKIAEAQALVIGRCLGVHEPEDVPSLSMQLCLFTFCYNIIRLVATPYWWFKEPAYPLVAAVIGLIGLGVLGWMLSIVASTLALFVGRGDLHLRPRHLSWTYVLAEQRLYRLRRSHLKASRSTLKDTNNKDPASEQVIDTIQEEH